MMNKLTKTIAAGALVAGAVFAAPLAANADTTYVPGAPDAIVATVNGSTFTAPFGDGTFASNSALTGSFTSTGAVPTTASATFRAATVSGIALGSSSATGSATVTGTIPADASAPITLTVVDAEGNSAVATIAVTAAGTGSSNLATTGTYISAAVIWGAVGLVALGGGLVAVRLVARRKGDLATSVDVA